MHLDEETIERALHGELAPAARVVIERHLASCTDCAARLTETERVERGLLGLLEELDHDPPSLDWEAVTREPPSGGKSRPLIAAGLATLLVGAGILAAIPGSPVREWIDGVLEDPAPLSLSPSADDAPRSGIAVVPTDPFEVVFTSTQTVGRIRVVLVAASRIELTVSGEPVELESGPDRLVVSNEQSSASYELQVPRGLETVRVRVAGDTVLEKRGESIRTTASRDAVGAYLLDLRPGED